VNQSTNTQPTMRVVLQSTELKLGGYDNPVGDEQLTLVGYTILHLVKLAEHQMATESPTATATTTTDIPIASHRAGLNVLAIPSILTDPFTSYDIDLLRGEIVDRRACHGLISQSPSPTSLFVFHFIGYLVTGSVSGRVTAW
jgi:hypothetical protein